MDAGKKQLWISGRFVEVTDEVYAAYMQGDRKIRYFENDLKTERVIWDKDGHIEQIIPSREDSLDRLMDDTAVQFMDRRESVEDTVFHRIDIEELYRAMEHLSPADYALIVSLFFDGKTEREYAEELGVYRNAVHKRKMRILAELKKLLE